MQSEPGFESDPFFAWSNGPKGSALKRTGAVLKDGPRIVKTVEYSEYGNPDAPKRQLQFHRFEKDIGTQERATVDSRRSAWACENDEIDRLITFLRAESISTGRYRATREPRGDAAARFEYRADPEVQDILARLADRGDLKDLLTAVLLHDDRALSAAQSAVLIRRRQLLEDLRTYINSHGATETGIQAVIGQQYWIFGGRYAAVADRRVLAMLDQHDIPLLEPDGALHIVELKGPAIERLVVRHRNHWIVGPQVHEATAQAANYLRSLDEQGSTMETVFAKESGQRYDMSRCFATVVVGNSNLASTLADREIVARTFRQYSASLNRIEVITYDRLIEAAERAIQFEDDSFG